MGNSNIDNRLLVFCGLGGMGLLARLLIVWFEKAAWLPRWPRLTSG